MSWQYDSGGKKKDLKKYRENYVKIFGKPCEECGMSGGRHKMSCSSQYKGEWDAMETR